MFRRKVRHSGSELPEVPDPLCADEPEVVLDPHRSRSTSELLSPDDIACRRRSGSGLFPGHSGLSVSHDSVFTAEQRSSRSSCEELHIAKSSSSLSIQQLVLPGVKAELVAAVRRRGRARGDTSEEDEDPGLPRSPCTSPTTADVLLEKENPTKSHSTCSDGSLLSMGSSEMDEDSFGQTSGHSSKLSLHDKKTVYYDNDMELDMGVSGVPLSHSAARHKMSVKPKRTHGAPRRRRVQQLSAASPLPATPEVNEEASGRSISPEPKEDFSAAFSTSDDFLALHRSSGPPVANSYRVPHETQLKSASLPPGLALSERETSVKLTRSRSSATNQRFARPTSDSEQDDPRGTCSTVGEEEEDEISKEKEDKVTFFGRLLSRRSGKKKKEKFEELDQPSAKLPIPSEVVPKRIDNKGRYANEEAMEYVHTDHEVVKPYGAKVGAGTRAKASARQRVEPINIPASPDVCHKEYDLPSLDAEQEVLDFSFQPHSHANELAQIPRLPGLGPFQHNITNVGVRDFDYEERECTSLIHANNERKPSSLLSVKKSRSFRGDFDYALPKSQFSNVPFKTDAQIDDETGQDSVNEDAVDVPFTEVTVSHSSPENIYLDSLEDGRTSSESAAFEEVNLIEEMLDEQKTVHTTKEEKLPFDQGRHFMKNNIVITRSIVKDSSHFGKTNNSFTITNTKQLMKKSSSLESVSSFGEGRGLTSPELSLASKKSSSTESIGSYTHTLDISKEKTVSYVGSESSTITHTTTVSAEYAPLPNHDKLSKHSFRSAAPKYTPNTPHVPEFLRVQLNRVDVKPSNVVLSTNVIFDSDKYSLPKTAIERRPSISKSNESLTKIIRISETSSESVKKDTSGMTQPSLREFRVRTESYTLVPPIHSSQTLGESLYASDSLEQESDFDSIEVPRSFAVSSQNNPESKISVATVSSEPVSTAPRLSVIDLDSAEVRKEILKKQMSSNYEDIKIIEKSGSHTEYENSVREVVPNKSKCQRKEDDKMSSNNICQISGDENEIFCSNRTTNKDVDSRKLEDKSLLANVSVGLQNTVMPEVVLRKKSLPRESGQQKDEEPELLKVFARRSLKLKDSDTENLMQPVVTKIWENHTSSDQTIKSRDSDKENEGGDSPREDRKKQHTKEPLTESKLHVETSEIVLRSSTSVVNSRLSNIPNKYQRSHSTGLENGGMNEHTPLAFRKESGGSPEKRQRNRTVPESPGSSLERTPHRMWAATRKEKDFPDSVIGEEKVVLKQRAPVIKSVELEPSSIDKVTDAVPLAPVAKDEGSIPRFKRIQQRREEWEKRAQQAAKRTVP